jgi:nicotinamidase-related amidase
MTGNGTRATFGDDGVLIVVDVQNDFCPGGTLAVPRGDEIIPIINSLAARFRNVVLTQDWHPRGHSACRARMVRLFIPRSTFRMPR